MFPKTVIIVTGPTASGKTELAMTLAHHFNTSIISADSRQCYRELNIGVAKPSAVQLDQVKHYFINSHSISEEVNASLFEKLAMQWCGEILRTRDVIVLSGGTGLYIKAFCEGLDGIPSIDAGLRNKIGDQYQRQGIQWLKDSLRIQDPLFYNTGETANPQRMMRALEIVQGTGRSILSFRNAGKKPRPFRILEFGMQIPRKDLYLRINQRVDQMMEAGLLDEVRNLFTFKHLNALQTVGYTELFDYLGGKTSLENAVTLIKQNTRHYAKRQLTWFNKYGNLIWLENDYLNKILAEFNSIRT